jgi:hypothetical protein
MEEGEGAEAKRKRVGDENGLSREAVLGCLKESKETIEGIKSTTPYPYLQSEPDHAWTQWYGTKTIQLAWHTVDHCNRSSLLTTPPAARDALRVIE